MIDNATPDWVGPSGRRKREPFDPPGQMQFLVPMSTQCMVRRLGNHDWCKWTTTRCLTFWSTHQEGEADLTFRREGWLIRVKRGLVNLHDRDR